MLNQLMDSHAPEMPTKGDPRICFALLGPWYHRRAEKPKEPKGRLLGASDLADRRLVGEQNNLVSVCDRIRPVA